MTKRSDKNILFVCKICGKPFPNRWRVIRHLNRKNDYGKKSNNKEKKNLKSKSKLEKLENDLIKMEVCLNEIKAILEKKGQL